MALTAMKPVCGNFVITRPSGTGGIGGGAMRTVSKRTGKVWVWLKTYYSKLMVYGMGLGMIVFAVCTTQDAYRLKITRPADLYLLLSPSLIWMIVLAAKLLAGFWIVAILVGIFSPERISELGAKIFGVEISQKYNRQELNDAKTGVENIRSQIKLLSDLNRRIYEYLSTPFEAALIGGESVPEAIRAVVRNILLVSYGRNFPGVEILVEPLFPETLQGMKPQIAASVQMLLNKDSDDIFDNEYDKSLGIAILRGFEELETLIVIDTSQAGYDVSMAELFSAGNLFLSIANTISAMNED
jgi:hypothetical protein